MGIGINVLQDQEIKTDTAEQKTWRKKTDVKIGMINVVLDGDYQYEQEIPLGFGVIGAFLRENGYTVEYHQCFISRGEEQADKAAKVEADLYAFQLNMTNYRDIRIVVGKIKKIRPQAKVVLGGPYLTMSYEQILQGEPLYDFMVMGEGEYTTLELVQYLERGEDDFSNVLGLVWRKPSGAVVKNNHRSLIKDLDAMPFPSRDLLETESHDSVDDGLTESVRMVTSRGCVANCSFCCVNLFSTLQKGKRWRGRSPKNVVDELEILYKKYGVRVVNFSDSSFEDPGKPGKIRAAEICHEIIRRDIPVSAKIYMRCETMLNEEDIELYKLFKKAGIDVIIMGVEAGSDYELELYKKNANLEENYQAMKTVHALDLFYLYIGFIMFGPYSTMETLRGNMKFLYENKFSDNLMFTGNTLMLLRDSKIYNIVKAEGRVIENDKYWELPKYTFVDPLAERMASFWQGLYARYPNAREVTSFQVRIANLVSRMTNRMNADVLKALSDEYIAFKVQHEKLRDEFGCIQSEHFYKMLDLISNDASDEKIAAVRDNLFENEYARYLPIYQNAHDSFVKKIVDHGFSLSGLGFKNFYSASAIKGLKRTLRSS